jgi:hypothetical protein
MKLKEALERDLGPGKLMSRNGGTLALTCPNPKCSSRSKGKLKLEVHLPSRLYSCWTCGIKGLIRRGTTLLRFMPANAAVLSCLSAAKEPALISDIDRMLAAFEGRDEFVEAEHTLEFPSPMLAAQPFGSAWLPWIERWARGRDHFLQGVQSVPEEIIGWAWRFDVRVTLEGSRLAYAMPLWGERELQGVLWWRPFNRIRYAIHGERKNILPWTHLHEGDTIFLVEGFWDMVRGGKGCVPLLGSSLPRGGTLENWIAKSGKRVIVVLDDDAQAKAWRIAKRLSSLGCLVDVASPPWGDPADQPLPIHRWAKPVPYDWSSDLMNSLEGLTS